MTTRERLESKITRRRAAAAKARARSLAAFGAVDRIASQIPLGQPILVGHHSERRHRKDIARIEAGMRRGCDEADRAEHHESTARGVERALARSIYRDDTDAVERLREKIAGLEAAVERAKEINLAWRSKDRVAAFGRLGVSPEAVKRIEADMAEMPWERAPMSTTNKAATLRREKARLAELEAAAVAPPAAARSLSGTIAGFPAELEEDPEEGRVTLRLGVRVPRETFRRIRSTGMLWSPSRGAFTRAGRGAWERAAAVFDR